MARSTSHSGSRRSATTVSGDGPASSTPHSSNTSRTAAQTSARASPSSHPISAAHSRGCGPAHGRSWASSRGSTPPPGNTHVRGANAMVATRRSMNTSTPATSSWPPRPDPSRTSITVAAYRGSTGSLRRPASHSAACGPRTPGAKSRTAMPTRPGSAGDGDDDLHLDRRVERQHRHADRRPRVHAGVAEDLAEQLAGAVDDAGLTGERRVADATKPTTLTTRATWSRSPTTGLDRGHGVERAGLGQRLGRRRRRPAVPSPTLPVCARLAGHHRQLAGGEDEVALADGGDVGRHRRGRRPER